MVFTTEDGIKESYFTLSVFALSRRLDLVNTVPIHFQMNGHVFEIINDKILERYRIAVPVPSIVKIFIPDVPDDMKKIQIEAFPQIDDESEIA